MQKPCGPITKKTLTHENHHLHNRRESAGMLAFPIKDCNIISILTE